MDYQEVLSRFTYDDGTDILNRVSSEEAGDYRENRDIINEIVLWKMNRRPQVTEELIDAIFSLKEIKTPLQVLTDEKTERVVEKLLQTKGMQLPMASTVLHFYYPKIFPIIDQRAYRELYAMDYPKTMTKIPMLPEIRSLNLSNSVAIVLYEALRQQGFESMQRDGELHRLHWKES